MYKQILLYASVQGKYYTIANGLRINLKIKEKYFSEILFFDRDLYLWVFRSNKPGSDGQNRFIPALQRDKNYD